MIHSSRLGFKPGHLQKKEGREMFRAYEDPYKLEKELEELEARMGEPGYELDVDDVIKAEELKERINFAWQDDEYDCEHCSDPWYEPGTDLDPAWLQ